MVNLPADPCVSRYDSFADQPELRAGRALHIIERRGVRIADFPRDVESQAGPARCGREEGLEKVRAQRFGDAHAIVDDAQFYRTVPRPRRDAYHDAARFFLAIAQ